MYILIKFILTLVWIFFIVVGFIMMNKSKNLTVDNLESLKRISKFNQLDGETDEDFVIRCKRNLRTSASIYIMVGGLCIMMYIVEYLKS